MSVLIPSGTNVGNHIIGMNTMWDFLKSQGWIHEIEQMVFKSECKLQKFLWAFIRKGKNQNFLDLNSKVMEVSFLKKSQDRIHQRKQVVFQSERKLQTFLRVFIWKGRNQDFSYLNPKVMEFFLIIFWRIFFEDFFFLNLMAEEHTQASNSVLWNLSR